MQEYPQYLRIKAFIRERGYFQIIKSFIKGRSHKKKAYSHFELCKPLMAMEYIHKRTIYSFIQNYLTMSVYFSFH